MRHSGTYAGQKDQRDQAGSLCAQHSKRHTSGGGSNRRCHRRAENDEHQLLQESPGPVGIRYLIRSAAWSSIASSFGRSESATAVPVDWPMSTTPPLAAITTT